MALPTTGLTAHVDASTTTNLFTTFVSGGPHTGTPVDGGTVAVWKDANVANQIFKQSGASSLPVWRSATPLMPLPCLDFTGGQRLILTTETAGSRLLSALITNTAYTILIAFYAESNTANTPIAYNGHPLLADTTGYFGAFLHAPSGVPKVSIFNWDINADYGTLNCASAAPHVLMVRHQSGTLYASLDGGAESSVASGNTGSLGGAVVVGAGSYAGVNLDGRLGEIAIYNTALTGTDLTDAVSYFTDKWLVPPVASTARVTHDVIETLSVPVPTGRVSHHAIEVLSTDTPRPGRVTQYVAELLSQGGGVVLPTGAWMTQMTVETLSANLIASQVTQMAVEILSARGGFRPHHAWEANKTIGVVITPE